MGDPKLSGLPIPVAPGELVAGKYRVERVLGIGGMGIVVAASHLQLQATVAIKFLLPQVAQHAEALERFLREARAAIQIRSEHVARVLDVDTLGDGTPYMVMEYLEGRDLAQRVMQEGPLPPEQVIPLMLQVCEALAEAHALGIIHRDLKPANLFLTQRRNGSLSVKVLDFGISKLSGSLGGVSMTHAATVMGSPLYMPPEQFVSAKNADARSDIWSLGIILYELLAGAPPFTEDTLPALCRQVTQEPPPSLELRQPGTPASLVSIVERCLEKDPALRYQTVAKLADELARLMAPSMHGGWGSASGTVPRLLVPHPVQTAPSGTFGGLQNTAQPPPPRRRWLEGAIVGGLLMVGGGLFWWGFVEPHRAPAGATATRALSGSAEPAPRPGPPAASQRAPVRVPAAPPTVSAAASGSSSAPVPPAASSASPSKSRGPARPSSVAPPPRVPRPAEPAPPPQPRATASQRPSLEDLTQERK